MSVLSRVMNIIKLASLTSVDDSKDYPSLNIKYFGNDKDVVRLSQYGFYSSPPVGSLAILFSPGADDAKMFAMADDYPNRYKSLKPGEVKMGNTVKGTFTYYNDAGDIQQVTESNNAFVGSTVYVGSPSVSLLEKISEALQESIDAFNNISLMATYPTAVGPTGTMIDPSTVQTAVTNLTAIKADIDSITGGAP